MPYPRLQISVRYLHTRKTLPSPTIENGADAYRVIKNIYNKRHILWREEVLLLCLSTTNILRSWDQVATGGMDYSNLDIPTFNTSAAVSACPKFIIAHNHPSGSLKPSNADFELTRQVIEALRIMRLHLVDHIIFTDKGFYSMKDEGLL